MRVMVLIKANEESEAGQMPDEKLLTEMGRFNEELMNAGVLLAGEGLRPSSHGKRVRFSGSTRTVIDGPFTESKELVASYAIFQVKDMDEAVHWTTRFLEVVGEGECELRPIFDAEDFGTDVFPQEAREQEARWREQMERNAQA